MTTLLDIVAFVFCTGSTIFVFKTALLAKNKYFWPIVIALVYASSLRLFVLLIDLKVNLFGLTKAHVQVMFSGVYILLFIGFAGIYFGLKNFFIPTQKKK